MSTQEPIRLDVVIYRDGEYWVAHCVQLDVLTSGSSMDEVWADIKEVCRGQFLFAGESDPECKYVFRPASERLTKMMSTGRDEGNVRVQMDGKSVKHNFAGTHDLRINFVIAECAVA